VLRTAIEHHVQASARDQVLLLYLQAVEPFFGLGERSEELARLRAKVCARACVDVCACVDVHACVNVCACVDVCAHLCVGDGRWGHTHREVQSVSPLVCARARVVWA